MTIGIEHDFKRESWCVGARSRGVPRTLRIVAVLPPEEPHVRDIGHSSSLASRYFPDGKSSEP